MLTVVLLQAASFVHPAMAGAALAAGLIPVLIHLINRRRYMRVPWAAMSFLLAASRRSARRIRLEQLLLLLTRVLVIVLFGLAAARPYVRGSLPAPALSSHVHRVLLIDNSLSMSARTSAGPTRFQLAKRYAERLLDSFPPTDSVSLVTLAAPAQAVIAHAAYDRRFVGERLASVTQTQRATDTAGALLTAVEILEDSEAATGNRAVYLISDLPRRDWLGGGTLSAPDVAAKSPSPAVKAIRRLTGRSDMPAADNLTVVQVAPGGSTPGSPGSANVAVTGLSTDSPLIAVNLPMRVAVEVTNFGSSTVNDTVLQVRSDGRIIRRERLGRLEARSSATVSITTEFAIPGTHMIEARIALHTADAVEEDNTRYLSIEVRERVPVLLVDGRPGGTRLAGQAGFLSLALAPEIAKPRFGPPLADMAGDEPPDRWATRRRRGTTPTFAEPKVITEPELAGEPLGDYEIIALCNVQRLSEQSWKRLEVFVAGGGGLLVFGGDMVDVDNYNRYGYAGGNGLLPGRLHRPRTPQAAERQRSSVPGGAVEPYGDATGNGAPVGFTIGDAAHPLVAEFAGHAESSLFAARVERYMPIEPDARRARVVLRYSNGDPALVASTYRRSPLREDKGELHPAGGGRVLVYTTTANLEWNNLPAKGDFVSLMLNCVAYLSPRRGEHRNITVGEWMREPLAPAEASLPLRVTTVDGATIEPLLVPADDRLTAEYGPVEQAGAMRLSIGSAVRGFAANVDAAESDPTTVHPQEFLRAVRCPLRLTNVEEALASDEMVPGGVRSTELASFALYIVVGLLLLEAWMAMWFGSQRKTPSLRRRSTTRAAR